MQSQLDNLYLKYLEIVFRDKELEKMIENYNVSSPQLLDIETPRANYLYSQYKILFIGKETNGWFNPNERNEAGLKKIGGQFEKYISALKKVYKRHNIGINYRSSIYLFIDLLIERLNEFRQTGILLTELLRHDCEGKGLPDDIIAKVTFDNNFILRKEIEILKPNALIFLTGPAYDKHLSMTYPMAVFQEHEGYSLNQIAVIENIPDVQKAIRIYHPAYHNRCGADFKDEMIKIISKFLN